MKRKLLIYCICITSFASLAVLALWVFVAYAPRPPLLDTIAFSPIILDRHGALLRMGLTPDQKYRVRVRLHEVAPEALQALLLYEDKYFYAHPGVNPLALARAVGYSLTGVRRMGGSTITMQVARLRLGLVTHTLSGKLEQIVWALRLEYHYTKREILEAYCNLAPYGGNVEGIGAAARLYFHVSADTLTLAESLALASVPQNPLRRSPLHGKDFDTARARMHALWATTGTTGGSVPDLRIFSAAHMPFRVPHLATELLPQAASVVHTYIDSGAQQVLERHVGAFAARGHRYGVRNAAALLVHWPSMEVRALVGSAQFHNPAIAGQIDGTRARRSPGSTLKPFIYALALDQGHIHPQTLLPDAPRTFAGYTPENYDRRFRGPVPAHEALRASRNVPAILLASQLKPDLYTFLQRAYVSLPFSADHYGLALVLGGAEVSVRELASLYAMLPNKGVWRPVRLHQAQEDEPSTGLLSPEAALVTLRMLEDENHILHTRTARIPLRMKTGTSNGFRDAWTAGIVGPYVLVVWVGNFDNSSNPLLVGADIALPLFGDIVRALSLREPWHDSIPALMEDTRVARVPVCTATGDLDVSLCQDVTQTWYIPGVSPTKESGVFRTLALDRDTGLRACVPDPTRTREVVWEFWPSDLQQLFLRAGIVKPPPPPFLPECGTQTQSLQPLQPLQPLQWGHAPRILSPREGVVYYQRLSDTARNTVPLAVAMDADADAVFWFDGQQFLGRGTPDTPLLWQATAGVHTLRAVDNRGRTSQRRVDVRAVP